MGSISPMKTDSDERPPVEIPLDSLSPAAQRGLIESFVLREGTDYGFEEVELDKKVEQVYAQIRSRKVVICFDPQTESIDILTQFEFGRRRRANSSEEAAR